MNRVALLQRTPAVTLCRFDHPPGATHHDPEYEVAPYHTISFVEAGSFDVRIERAEWTLGPSTLFVTTTGMGFSCRHDCETPTDQCLSVSFTDETVEDLRSAGLAQLEPPFARTTARQAFLRHRLQRCGPQDSVRLELLAGALYESLAAGGPAAPVASDTLTTTMRRVDRAIELIETAYARNLTLNELAQAAGLSAFHFARAFRTLTGIPPHRYLTAVRLRHAAARLHAGESVTHTCYEVGFGSLSHFVTAFRKRFGILPSEMKRRTTYPGLRAALSQPIWVAPRSVAAKVGA